MNKQEKSWISNSSDKRSTFIDTLIDLRAKDESVFLIVPDVGFRYIEKFNNLYPDSFLNTGVTEQSTIVLAATMALKGFRTFVYSMIPFVLFRPGEQVRNAIVVHKAPVILLGVQGGLSYSFLGKGHNMLHDKEDINFCTNIGLKSYIPQDNDGVRRVIKHIYQSNEPAYIRL